MPIDKKTVPAVAETLQCALFGRPVDTIIPVLEDVRAYTSANSPTITRDTAILEEITKLLRAKIADEQSTETSKKFLAPESESFGEIRERIDLLISSALPSAVKMRTDGCISLLDDDSLIYAVRALEEVELSTAGRDVIGEAFESLIFPNIRGGQGQFFTPRNIGRCLIELLNIQPGERVIDPASGPGGFLVEIASKRRAEGTESPAAELVGIEKDSMLAELASDNLLLRFGAGTIACGNSLAPVDSQSDALAPLLEDNSYDVVITNPPFGAKIPVMGEDTLRQFDLARRWKRDQKTKNWTMSTELKSKVPPQVLFIERCWQLLRDGGRCGIVLPEGLLGNATTGYIRQWLLERADIIAVVDCPLEAFMPSTSTKTVLLVFQKTKSPVRPPVFMAVAEKCGHTRRGKPLKREDGSIDDDFPKISKAWKALDGRQ